MRSYVRTVLAVTIVGLACGDDVTISETGATAASAGGGSASSVAASSATTGGGGAPLSASCPDGEFATALDGASLSCTSIDAVTRDTLNSNCSVYFGWLDDCDGCAGPPAKWGRVSGTACANGAGADNTCTTAMLGSAAVDLFGLNPDGDVDGNDKLFVSWHCGTAAPLSHPGPCAAGELLTAIDGARVTCTDPRSSILGFARQSCWLYFGWRDGCDGCADPPAKWGRANVASCLTPSPDSTCSFADLDGQHVQLFGLNPDGDVDGNDKLYLGFHCFGATPTHGPEPGGACPPEQYVTGLYEDGSVECAVLAPAVAQYIAQGCKQFFGWRDSCDGCTLEPDKWGAVTELQCELGAGADDTCSSAMLGSGTIELFGLNPDGDTDGNDKLYVGTKCF